MKRKEWIDEQVMKIFDINLNEVVSNTVTIKVRQGFVDVQEAKRLVLEKLLNANKPMERLEIVTSIYEDIKDKLTDYDKEPTKSNRIRWEGFVRWAVTNLGKDGFITNIDGENKWIIADKGREALQGTHHSTRFYLASTSRVFHESVATLMLLFFSSPPRRP